MDTFFPHTSISPGIELEFDARLRYFKENIYGVKIYKNYMNIYVVKVEDHVMNFNPAPWMNYQGEYIL